MLNFIAVVLDIIIRSNSAWILFFGYANKTVAPAGAICEFSTGRKKDCRLLYSRKKSKRRRIQNENMYHTKFSRKDSTVVAFTKHFTNLY